MSKSKEEHYLLNKEWWAAFASSHCWWLNWEYPLIECREDPNKEPNRYLVSIKGFSKYYIGSVELWLDWSESFESFSTSYTQIKVYVKTDGNPPNDLIYRSSGNEGLSAFQEINERIVIITKNVDKIREANVTWKS